MGFKRDLVSFSTHDWVCVTNWTCIVLNVNILKVFSARTSHLQFSSNISPLTFTTAHWWESSILRKHVQFVVWKLLISSITAPLFCSLGLLITLHMGGRLLVVPCFLFLAAVCLLRQEDDLFLYSCSKLLFSPKVVK